jgi:hypothetical protein
MRKGMGEIHAETEGNVRDTGGSWREWERYRAKLKGTGEIQ